MTGPLKRLGARALLVPAVPALALATALGLAAPASAATGTVTDPVDHIYPAYSDLRSMTVRNGPHEFTAFVHLRSVRPDKTSAYVLVSDDRHGVDYSIGTESSGHSHRAVFVRFGSEDNASKVTCKSLQVLLQPKRHRMVVRFRQNCLTYSAGRLAISALTEVPGSGDDQDITREIVLRRG
jgi:hypothetical protein